MRKNRFLHFYQSARKDPRLYFLKGILSALALGFIVYIAVSIIFINFYYGAYPSSQLGEIAQNISIFASLIFSVVILSRKYPFLLVLPVHILILTSYFSYQGWVEERKMNERMAVIERYGLLFKTIPEDEIDYICPEYLEEHVVSQFKREFWIREAIKSGPNISPYAVGVYNDSAFLIPSPSISKNNRPQMGFGIELEKVNGEWCFNGEGALFED
ncbi:MAG: hypothetical protein AAF490_22360 [Chloroflexota bacterium]